MADGLNRFLGDTPTRTFVKLLVVSVVVGFIMNVLGLSPMDLVRWVSDFANDIWRSGFAALGRVGDYIIIGAVIVVPLFILMRLLNWRKG